MTKENLSRKCSMVYICGIFEKSTNLLPQSLKTSLEKEGYTCKIVELYPNRQFGSYSFQKEVERIKKEIFQHDPVLIIGHSLGAFLSLEMKEERSLLLLDPSFSVKDIILPHLKRGRGDLPFIENEGEKVTLSNEFVEDLPYIPSIEDVTKSIRSNSIFIVGAEKGGHKIAEQYHKHIPSAEYTIFPNADHNFSDKESMQQLLSLIKKRLEFTSSRLK